MKTIPSFKYPALFALAIGSSPLLFATPQEAPVEPNEIAEFIQMDVAADSQMGESEVRVELKEGVALLSGHVRSLAQAERAAARAIASNGVRSVVNQLVIEESQAKDISMKAKEALRSQKMVAATDVALTVSGNRVALKGSVGTLDEKELLREIVSEVPGVAAIDNKLDVTFEGVRSDPQIQEQLRFMIHDDPLYDGLDLVITVDSGTARIAGTVGSKGEYDRLVRRSYVTGIMDVQISGLHIDTDLKMEALGDKNYNQEESMVALNQALKIDPRIDPSAVQVQVDEGVVTLRGSVHDLAAKDAAESTSRTIPGILRVDNRLKISPARIASNAPAIAASAPLVGGR